MNDKQLSNNIFARYIWISIGILSFILGTIGIFLPLLPTFPFYLLTLACFTKGSKRLHHWFISSKFYQNTIAEFTRTHTLAFKTKLKILFSLSVLMGIGAYFMHYTWSRVVLGIVWLVHIIYIGFIIKTTPRQ